MPPENFKNPLLTGSRAALSSHSMNLRNVLVTGAGAGIGLAIARRLSRREDLRLILTARAASLVRLEDAGFEENDRVWLRPLDVTSGKERERLIAEIDETLGGVDVLVNNAGITYRSVVEHVTEEERLLQMGVNFRGPMELSRLVLPSMRRKRAGRILNVSSVGGMMAMPTMAVYSASKFALEGASESLYYEVRPWNIQVCLLQLGFINSDAFLKVPHTPLSAQSARTVGDPYHAHYAHMADFIGKNMRRSLTKPETVARKIEKLVDRRRLPLRKRVTPDAKLFNLMRKFVPARLYHNILYAALPGVRSWGPASEEHTQTPTPPKTSS